MMTTSPADRLVEDKMRTAGVGEPTIRAFLGAVHKVRTGERGLVFRICHVCWKCPRQRGRRTA